MRCTPLIPVVVALALLAAACGDSGEETVATTVEATATTSGSTSPEPTEQTTNPTSSEPALPGTSSVEQTEPTIYRPEPVHEGDRVIAEIVPVEGVALEGSSVSLQIVDFPDGRFLEMDLADAVVPPDAAFWTTEINGRSQGRSTARQGSTMGHRVDEGMYGDTLIVVFSAIAADGTLLASTGEVEIVDDALCPAVTFENIPAPWDTTIRDGQGDGSGLPGAHIERPGAFINLFPGGSIWAPSAPTSLTVDGRQAEIGTVEDGLSVRVTLTGECGAFDFVAYGVPADELRAVIAAVRFG